MIKATPINEGQKPTVLGVEMRRLGIPALTLSVPLDDTFYADITTRNTTGSAVTKDFLAVFGTYDPATGGFTINWSHVRTGVGVATGEAKNTVNCTAALAGTWDALGAIGTYNSATGAFTIESAVVLEDALTVEKPAPPPPPPAKGELRNPSYPSEVGATESWTGYIYGCNVGGSRGTFRFRVDSSTTGSFGLDPGYCSRCEFSGTGPADFYIYLERYDGGWIVDDSHRVVIREEIVPPPGEIRVKVSINVAGRVYPFSGVPVYLDGVFAGKADADGLLTITGVSKGTHKVKAAPAAMTPITKSVTVPDGYAEFVFYLY